MREPGVSDLSAMRHQQPMENDSDDDGFQTYFDVSFVRPSCIYFSNHGRHFSVLDRLLEKLGGSIESIN